LKLKLRAAGLDADGKRAIEARAAAAKKED